MSSATGADVVVVLNYRGTDDTLACVDSLRRGSAEAVVLVVDNDSAGQSAGDDVLELVALRWPDVATLRTGSNLGFAGGMNAGLRWAIERGASTVTVLNNDTIVGPGAVAALSQVARTGAAVSPVVRYADGTDRVWFGGGTVDVETNLARHLDDDEISRVDAGAPGRLRPTESLAGCCVTATRETWQHVGLFDERYFLNFEDSDWSARAGELGVSLVIDTHTTIRHRVSASFTGGYSWLGLYYYTRNGLLFGRGRRRGTLGQAGAFMRRHVIPAITGELRAGHRREAGRRALVVVRAVTDHLVGRYGRAPRGLESRADRWAADRRRTA